MHINITESLTHFNGKLVAICSNESTPPEGAYQVNFNRLEIILEGEYDLIVDAKDGCSQLTLKQGEMVYIPSNAWSKPTWDKPCKMVSVLFGKHQVGFSFVQYTTEGGFVDVQKHALSLPSSMALEHVLDALNCMSDKSRSNVMGEHLANALILYCLELLDNPVQSKISRSEKLYRSMCIYVQENFHKDITRVSVANRFGVSSAHVSRLFNQEGSVKYADYVTYVRLDRAKFMLKKYNFKLEEIAHRCGFKDTNYFCRVFKNKTGKTPSGYRLGAV
ncbi:AraC family transcriptional regulator [Enterovibrio norvegicus FF-33]|uniref:AraC family transcriptional regulator n=1 Tax=Enterovibrio norvegicus TaxID=188144 RepID=UPI0002D2D8D0|nr:AraC family transcriptional regulator [Enterovibrio norvegicus]OEE66405.1 AraC family transcriptional regulator [Enterovibrio norvegicus FF-33]